MNDFASLQVFKEKILVCLEEARFEDAIKINNEFPVHIHPSEIQPLIDNLTQQAENSPALNQGQLVLIRRQIKALKAFRDFGPEAERMIATIELPEGYAGKIMMLMILNGVVQEKICLRSNDLWHREILRNAEAELKDLGFFSSTVAELGGAFVRFEKDSSITIYGTSDDFGACDKWLAADLIKAEYPDRKIHIQN